MKNIIVIFLLALMWQQSGNCQETKKKMWESKDSIESDIYDLSSFKYAYEENAKMAIGKPDKYVTKRNEYKKKYTDLLKKVRKNPSDYLPFLNKVIEENDSTSYMLIPYMYNNSLANNDPRIYMVSRLELCKIVKTCLFERNMKELPQDFRTLSFITKRKAKVQTADDIF